MKIFCRIEKKEFEGDISYSNKKTGWVTLTNKKKESFTFNRDNPTVKILEQ